jgi:hypothetical protein
MSDDEPFYSPNRKPTPAVRKPIATEPLWELRKGHVVWSGDLRFHGEEYRWEARTLRDGELHLSRRFMVKENAIRWAESERADREKGWAQ